MGSPRAPRRLPKPGGLGGGRTRRRTVRAAAIGALWLAAVAVLVAPSATASAPRGASGPTVVAAPAPLALNITFAVNSTTEVDQIISDGAWIQSGDSFDLVSGSPAREALNVSAVDAWAEALHAAFPAARIYAHTAGVEHVRTLARKASRLISGIFYDYEPHYEREFTTNFSRTLSNFAEATALAHQYGRLSIGYPTGQEIARNRTNQTGWDYATIAGQVDGLVVQTQAFCHRSTASLNASTDEVLAQYSAAGWTGAPPTFGITVGATNVTPNGVPAAEADACASAIAAEGLHALYVWWAPGTNAQLVEFLAGIGRAG